MSQLILPGDPVSIQESSSIGPGIYETPIIQKYIPTRAGLLTSKTTKRQAVSYIESNSRRYTPAQRDHVVGVISAKNSEGYRVLLQDHTPPVRLDQFAFENASKKNKPNLAIGSLVYARVANADKDIEVDIECVDATTGKSAGFGELKGGFVVEVSLGFARQLLFEGHPVLTLLGERTPFEIAIGMNGKIWVDAPERRVVWIIARCIQDAEKEPQSDADKIVKRNFK